MPLIFRSQKGALLTSAEIDNNFSYLDDKVDQKVNADDVGASVAPLENGEIPRQYLPVEVLNGLKFMGDWNAATNTPNLTTVAPSGQFYIVSVPGTFGGVSYDVGDWIISNGTTWTRYTLTVPTDAVSQSIGTGANQWPLNQMLGELAFMNRDQLVMALKAAVTPHRVGDMVFQLTNDTTLVAKAKGKDGVVRSVTWTLA